MSIQQKTRISEKAAENTEIYAVELIEAWEDQLPETSEPGWIQEIKGRPRSKARRQAPAPILAVQILDLYRTKFAAFRWQVFLQPFPLVLLGLTVAALGYLSWLQGCMQ